MQDVLELGKRFKVWKLRNKIVTYKDTKYDEEEFKLLVLNNDAFLKELKDGIIYNLQNKTEIIEDESTD